MNEWMRTTTLLLCVASSAIAQGNQGSSATSKIPVRQLSAPEAVTRDTLGAISGLREFADGRVLVNDVARKRLIVFEKNLATYSVVADTTGKPTLYPGRTMMMGFLDYVGDSALLADGTSMAFLVVAPNGKIARAMAPQNPRELTNLSVPYAGSPAFDPRGRFIYRGQPAPRPRPVPGAPPPPPRTRDTVPILRSDFDRRTTDTIGYVTVPVLDFPLIVRDDKGKASATQVFNPLPMPPDEWVITSDGSLAVLKPIDYHIDWVHADGTKQSTPKMPFDWRPLRDEDKQARIDSMKHVIDSTRAEGRHPIGVIYSSRAGGGMDTVIAKIEFAPYSEMPDYVPPFRAYTAKADKDNNVWIPPTTTMTQQMSGFLYDVINKKGEIFERVAIPGGRLVAGFGPGGVVYVVSGNREAGYVLERRRIIRPGT